jgi:hypothetical protein
MPRGSMNGFETTWSISPRVMPISRTNLSTPSAHFQLAAALALLGSFDEARAAERAGLALDSTFTLRRLRGFVLSNDPAFRTGSRRIRDGMLMAGVPQG